MVTGILLCGVGGQGTITASSVLSEAALRSGWDIKKSEVHGMSQRGGSVETHVRVSPDEAIASPLIEAGTADILVAFEALEGLRKLPMTRADGTVLTDEREIVPMSVVTGRFGYPGAPLDRLAASGRTVHVVPAFRIACELGEPRAANMVMLGAVSNLIGFEAAAWEDAMRGCLRPRALPSSLEAFEAGAAALKPA